MSYDAGQDWGLRLDDAVARFNTSDATRTVAGLSRTLGTPRVSIGAAAGSPAEVRITVAWDLTWYQWGVDVEDADRPVFEIGQGGEIADLDGSARVWNGCAGRGGRVFLGRSEPAPIGRRERLLRALT